MSSRAVEIVACPPAMCLDALSLVLSDLTLEQRREFAPTAPGKPVEALVAAICNGELIAAGWGQRQPGSTAIFWPPQLYGGDEPELLSRLACGVAAALDAAGIRMAQVLLADRVTPLVPTLEAAGFSYLTDLLYLNWEADGVANSAASQQLEFEPYRESEQERLAALIETTYESTQDCASLNGKRPMDEVLAGYCATGSYRPENFFFVRAEGEDVGLLLLADHRVAKHWELMYMGLVPSVRGRRFGKEVVRHAQRLVNAARVERLVLAVDAENLPAIKMYNETGFRAWDRRSVFVRFAT
jgi:ribosomal protein S18 acetylase RimI-like enzyme